MSSEFAQLADDLMTAIVAGDLTAADRLYADNVIVWHNYDRIDRDKAASLGAISAIHQEFREFWITDVRRDYLDDGYVQRTVFHGIDRAGTEIAVDAMMRVWVHGSQITRIEEYSHNSP